jgi:hypothetical protein
MYARTGNILLSLLGPAYFGFMHSPYVVFSRLVSRLRGDFLLVE